MVDLDSKDLEQFVKFHTGQNMVRKKSAWEKFRAKDKLLLLLLSVAGLLAAAAIFVLATPLTSFILNLFDLYIEGWAQLSTWLMDGDVGLVVAIVLGIFSILFLLLARFRYLRDRSTFIDAGCPDCHEQELIRIRRYRRDRLFGFFGVPMRRYACRNCTWQGTRLAKYAFQAAAIKGETDVEHTESEFVSGEGETLPQNGNVDISEQKLQEVTEPTNLKVNN